MTAVRIDVWVQTAGLGHVTRQLALMDAVRAQVGGEGAHIRFVTDSSAVLQNMVHAHGHAVFVRNDDPRIGARQLADTWAERAPRLFVLDSVDHDRLVEMRPLLEWPGVTSLTVIDDPEDRDAPGTLVLNALPGSSRHPRSSRHLRGAEYLIHSPDFAEFHARARGVPTRAMTGFVFFGGADGNNMTPILLDAVAGLDAHIEWTVLLGMLYPQADDMIARIRSERLPMRVMRRTDALAHELWSADLAVLATGNVLSEAIAVGVPVIGFAQTPTQDLHARYFRDRCRFSYLGMYSAVTPARLRHAIESVAADGHLRTAMRRRMLATVDGEGACRVARCLLAPVLAERA